MLHSCLFFVNCMFHGTPHSFYFSIAWRHNSRISEVLDISTRRDSLSLRNLRSNCNKGIEGRKCTAIVSFNWSHSATPLSMSNQNVTNITIIHHLFRCNTLGHVIYPFCLRQMLRCHKHIQIIRIYYYRHCIYLVNSLD